MAKEIVRDYRADRHVWEVTVEDDFGNQTTHHFGVFRDSCHACGKPLATMPDGSVDLDKEVAALLGEVDARTDAVLNHLDRQKVEKVKVGAREFSLAEVRARRRPAAK